MAWLENNKASISALRLFMFQIMDASEEALTSIHRLEAIFEALMSKAPLVDNVVVGRRAAGGTRNTLGMQRSSPLPRIFAQQIRIHHHFKVSYVTPKCSS